MRILTVASWVHPESRGGSQRYIAELATRLARRGHQVRLLTQRVSPTATDMEDRDGVAIRRFDVGADRGPILYRDTIQAVSRILREELTDFAPHVVHGHQLLTAFAAARALRGGEVPFLTTFHFPYFLEHLDKHRHASLEAGPRMPRPFLPLSAALLRRMDERVLRTARTVITLSEHVADLVRQFFPSMAPKLCIIPGAVDTEYWSNLPGRAQARATLGLPPEGARWITVRRLEVRMGIDRLLEAFAQIAPDHPDLHLDLIGDGSERAALERLGQRFPEGNRIHLHGAVEDDRLRLHLAAADLFVLPTRALEGFGLATLESLAAGLPTLGTPVGGTSEILQGLEPAWILPGTSSADMARGIRSYLANGPHHDPKEIRAYVEQNYSWDKLLDAYEELLLRITR